MEMSFCVHISDAEHIIYISNKKPMFWFGEQDERIVVQKFNAWDAKLKNLMWGKQLNLKREKLSNFSNSVLC